MKYLLVTLLLILLFIFYKYNKEGFRGMYGNGWYYPPNYYYSSYVAPYVRPYFPYYYYAPVCKNGCAYLGNGSVGCLYPTYDINSCLFASDCFGC
jgi:hypothetical protein